MELGRGMLDKLIYMFCDSEYINSDNYLETPEGLIELFYEFRNETDDRLTDDELLAFMKEQFEGVCFGDLDWFDRSARHYAPQIENALRFGCLDRLFRSKKGKRYLSQYLFPIYNHHFYTAGSRLFICRQLHLSLLIQEVFKNITVPLRMYVFSGRISELLPVHTPEQVLPAHSPLRGCRTGMLRI